MTSSSSKIQTIPTPLPKIQIVYNFVSESEEKYLIEKVDVVGGKGESEKKGGWVGLNGRRSMYWGGTVLPNSNTLIPIPFPKFVDSEWPNVLTRINSIGLFDELDNASGSAISSASNLKGKGKGFNHCLVNEYIGTSSQGIMPHTDGPAYSPLVATVSLGSHTILVLTPSLSSPSSTTSTESTEPPKISEQNQEEPKSISEKRITIFLPPRSLLLLSEDLYSNYLHSIESKSVDFMEEDLKKTLNWSSWWESGADGLNGCGGTRQEEDKDDAKKEEEIEREEEVFEFEEELKKLKLSLSNTSSTSPSLASASITPLPLPPTSGSTPAVTSSPLETLRRFTEDQGKIGGWERGRRISLTFRRVEKVRRGLLRLG